MAYAELGNPSGDPVLLIQGSFFADAFLPLARTFELQEYRLILVNLRGYGRSSKVEAPFGEADYAKDMEALIAALDVTSVHVVGHSYGGNIALQLAMDSPHSVRTLTLIEPGGFCSLRPELCPPRPPRDDSRSADSYTVDDTRAAVDDRISRLFGGMQTIEQIPGAYEQMLADIGDTYFGVQHSPMTPRWDFDPAQHLPDLDQPILFIYFDVGNAGHPTYSEMFRQHHAATEVVSLEGSHHSFHLEQPHETAEAIAAFLERNAAESSRSQGVN
jgi:pimeloyl-ACP methyl ester carboxylesterase